MSQAPITSPFVSGSSAQSGLAQHSSNGSSTRGLLSSLKCPSKGPLALESGCCASRPPLVYLTTFVSAQLRCRLHLRVSWLKTGMQVTTVCLPILLLGITVCSLVPLAGNRGGWATFSRAGLSTDSLRDLGLQNWNHTIDIGYDQVGVLLMVWCARARYAGNGGPEPSIVRTAANQRHPSVCLGTPLGRGGQAHAVLLEAVGE